MDDNPYATLGADGWFRCDGLHRPGFLTLLWDVLHRFGYMGLPAYPTDPTMTAWFTTARGDDLDDTLGRAAHQALTEFCERHQLVLGDTAIALIPVRDEGNMVWSERVATIGDPEVLTHHAGWALTACYAQHMSSMLQQVTATGAHFRLLLEECAGQTKAQNRAIKNLQEDNRELFQKNARLKTRIRELNDVLRRTYRSSEFKTHDLDDTRIQLQHAQDNLTATQSYVHYLET
jgi:hypothetical protein